MSKSAERGRRVIGIRRIETVRFRGGVDLRIHAEGGLGGFGGSLELTEKSVLPSGVAPHSRLFAKLRSVRRNPRNPQGTGNVSVIS
jgi:hypothetical protein